MLLRIPNPGGAAVWNRVSTVGLHRLLGQPITEGLFCANNFYRVAGRLFIGTLDPRFLMLELELLKR